MNRSPRHHQMQISEAELEARRSDMVDAQRDASREITELHRSLSDSPFVSGELDESADNVLFGGLSRRRFLSAAGLFAGAGLLVSSGAAAAATRTGRVAPAAAPKRSLASSAPLGVVVAALAASLENLAVSTYSAALSAASAGKLGSVPAAVGDFVVTARAQHADHAAAWNAIVTKGGYHRISAPNATLAKSVNASFAKVTDVPGVARLALSLENAAAATYLEAIGALGSSPAIATAASIQPVEMQHAAILHFILGEYPVPAAYATSVGAAPVSYAPSLVRA